MSRFLGLTIAVVGGFLVTSDAETVRAESFPDKHLESAVRSSLHLDDKAELNEEALRKLFVLEAPAAEIQDLKGLEQCRNLALIKLSKNQITDLTPLAGLENLQSLDLSGNQISDVAPLSELKNLQFLELSNNQISSVEPLSGLTKLSALYLDNNQTEDITSLGKLSQLTSLHLAKNKIQKIDALANVNKLSTLDLSDNQIEDLSPLKNQKEIKLLILERNKIQDLQPLVEMAKADFESMKRFAPFLRLYLAGNPLPDSAEDGIPRTAQIHGSPNPSLSGDGPFWERRPEAGIRHSGTRRRPLRDGLQWIRPPSPYLPVLLPHGKSRGPAAETPRASPRTPHH